MGRHNPVDCVLPHTIETVHVGRLPRGETGPERPATGSQVRLDAFDECIAKANDFLGAHFKYGRVYLELALPADPDWATGARWFRCDAWEYEFRRTFSAEVTRTGTLRGSLASGGPLRWSCILIKDDRKTGDHKMVPCQEPHNAEFIEVLTVAPGDHPTPDSERAVEIGFDCRGAVERFLGISVDDAKLIWAVKPMYWRPTQYDWEHGDRAATCIVWFGRSVTGSMKGRGPELFS